MGETAGVNVQDGSVWLNLKTQQRYRVIDQVEDATNGREGQWLVIYEPEARKGRYAREYREFIRKFRLDKREENKK